MRYLYMKQKVFSLQSKFTVKDQNESDLYFIEGSFMKLPKTFLIMDDKQDEVARITKKTFSFVPKFFVDVHGQEPLTIRKEYTWFKSRYTIDSIGIEVIGNLWDVEFEVMKNNQIIGRVNKKWFTWGDSYQIEILDETMETTLIALVVAIDCIKADENNTVATMSST